MKFSIFSLVMAAALVAGAETSSNASTAAGGNVYGVLRVASSAKETIVAIPWLGASADGSAEIKVADIIKTANLADGDMLYAYVGGSYKAWTIVTEGGIKVWQAVTSASTLGKNSVVANDATDQTLKRGDAVLLKRDKPGECFYLFGQYTSGSATTSIVAGSTTTPVWNYIAPPSTGAYNPNTANGWSDCANDVMFVPQGDGPVLQLTYGTGGWGYDEMDKNGRKTGNRLTNTTIPAGTGVMYKSCGAAKTITW